MAKSAQAFRTIREVADWLGVEAHVLRFWESKFPQIKPVKRAGGRRYYRPADMYLIGGIKVLLHDEGYTIRGVQKLIKDDGLDAVTGKAPPLDGEDVTAADAAVLLESTAQETDEGTSPAVDHDQVPLPFDAPVAQENANEQTPEAEVTPAEQAKPAKTEPEEKPEKPAEAPASDGDPLGQLADLISAAPAKTRNAAKKALAGLIDTMRKDPVS